MRFLFFAGLGVSSFAFAQSGPTKLNISGSLFHPSGAPVVNNAVNFKIEIWDKNSTCVLYSEEHLAQDLAASKGGFSLQIGNGSTIANFIDGANPSVLSTEVFKNSGAVAPFTGCASGLTLSSGDERMIRVYYDFGSGLTAMSPDVPVYSSAYAMVAETLQGKGASEFVQVRDDATYDLNQSNVETIFSAVNFAKLVQILSGNFGGSTVSNVGTPSAGTDATNKNYVDANIGGKTADVAAVGPAAGDGHTLIWDMAQNKWVTGVPAATDSSKLPLAGGTMTGAIAMGAQNITNIGHMTMAAQRTLNLGTYDNAQEGVLVSTLAGADKGKIWFNSQDNVFKVWNGLAAVSTFAPSGPAGGDLTGTYPNPTLDAGVVATTELANDAVTAAKINGTGIAVNRLLVTDATTGATVTYKTCNLGEALHWTASGWACANIATLLGTSGVTAATYGSATQVGQFAVDAQGRITTAANVNITFPVVSVAGKTGAVTLNAADISGLGTAAAKNFGTAAGNLVELDASARLPALDGSQLTGLSAAQVSGAFADGGNTFTATANLGTNSNHALNIETNGSPVMSFLANGNTGIATTAPVDMLTVTRNAAVNDSTRISVTTAGTLGNQQSALNLVTVDNGAIMGTSAANKGWQIYGRGGAFSTVAQQNDFGISYWSGGGWTDAVRIDSTTGYFSLGTVNAPSRLTVQGSVAIDQITADPAGLAGYGTLFVRDDGKLYYRDGTGAIKDLSSTGTGSVTSVVAGAGLTGGNITATGTLAVDVGTTAGKIVQMTASSKLPAVNGSDLTGLTVSQISGAFADGGNTFTAAATLGTNSNHALNIETNGATAMTILADGKVGIGQTNPGAPLEISSTGGQTILLRDNDDLESANTFASYIRSKDSAGTDVWYIGDGSTTARDVRFYAYQAVPMHFGTNSQTRMTILDTGNVGIGTTSPSHKFHVEENVDATSRLLIRNSNAGSSAIAAINVGNDTTALLGGLFATSSTYPGYGGANSVNLLNVSATGNLALGTNNSVDMTILPSGNVGIGTNTPTQKLEVTGAIKAGTGTATNGTTILLDNYGSGNLTVFGTERSSGGPVIGYGVIPSTVTAGDFTSSTPTVLPRSAITVGDTIRFYTGASQTVAVGTAVTTAEVMRISNTGNVGIGTNLPSQKLEVAGNIKITGVGTGITFNDGSTMTSAGVGSATGVSNATDAIVTGDSDANASGTVRLRTGATDRLTVLNGGDIGIGTGTPGGLGDGATPRVMQMYQAAGQSVIALTTGLTADLSTAGSVTFGTTGTAGAEKRTAVITSTLTGSNAVTTNGTLNFFTAKAGAVTNKMVIDPDGHVGIGVLAPTATLHMKAGAAAANGAPLKFTAGTNLTTPENGAVEYDGTDLYITSAGTRRKLAQASTANDFTNVNSITGSGALTVATGGTNGALTLTSTGTTGAVNINAGTSSGPINLNPGTTGVVNVNSTVASTSTTTGAMVVDGGIGVAGAGYFGGSLDVNGNLSLSGNAGSSRLISRGAVEDGLLGIFGGSGAGTGANIELYGGSHATAAGNAYVDSNNFYIRSQNGATNRLVVNSSGNVGIGTSTPSSLLTLASTGTPVLSIGTAGDTINDQAAIHISTLDDGALLGTAVNRGWQLSGRGNAFSIAAQQNDLQFNYWNGSAYSSHATIDSATGNFGIGTTAPAYPLHVEINTGGILALTDSDATGSRISIGEGASGAGIFFPLFYGRPVGSATPTALYSDVAAAEDTGANPVMVFTSRREGATAITTRPVFQWRNNTSNLMTVTATGNMGIGTATPQELLHLNNASGDEGTTGIFIQDPTATQLYGGSLYFDDRGGLNVMKMSTKDNGVETGYISMDRVSGRVGIGTTAPAANLHVTGSAIVAQQMMILADEKGAGVPAGDCTSGSWLTRDLNTVRENSITGASLASNQITLPAGTYIIEGSAPAMAVDIHQARFYNVTDAADAILGTAEVATSGATLGFSRSVIMGKVTIAASKVFTVRHRCETTRNSNGLGRPTPFGGANEVYTLVKITRVQ